MRSWYVSRKQFWVYVSILLVLKYALVIGVELRPELLRSFGSYLGALDNAMMLIMVLVIGARFADVGWPRWLGIVLAGFVVLVVPIVILMIGLPASPDATALHDLMPASMWIATALLFLLLIVSGAKSGAPREVPLPVAGAQS